MPPEHPKIAVKGAWGVIEWAADLDGRSQARDFHLSLTPADQAKVLTVFRYLAEQGKISNREKFKKVEELLEFKSGQIRFIGDFRSRPGENRFVVAYGLRKKQERHRMRDIENARRILRIYDTRTEKKRAK